jgi:hypothetical protein
MALPPLQIPVVPGPGSVRRFSSSIPPPPLGLQNSTVQSPIMQRRVDWGDESSKGDAEETKQPGKWQMKDGVSTTKAKAANSNMVFYIIIGVLVIALVVVVIMLLSKPTATDSSALTDQLSKKTTELQEANAKLAAALAAGSSGQSGDAAALNAEIASLKAQINKLSADLSAARVQEAEKLAAKTREADALKARLAEETAKLTTIQARHAQEIDQLIARNDETIQALNTQHAATVADLQAKLAAEVRKQEKLQADYKESLAVIQKLMGEELNRAVADRKDLTEKLKQATERISVLETELELQKKTSAESAALAESRRHDIIALGSDVRVLKIEIEKRDAEIRQLSTASAQLTQLNNTITQLNAQIDALRAEKIACETRTNPTLITGPLMIDMSDYLKMETDLRGRISTITAQLNTALADLKVEQDKVKALTAQIFQIRNNPSAADLAIFIDTNNRRAVAEIVRAMIAFYSTGRNSEQVASLNELSNMLSTTLLFIDDRFEKGAADTLTRYSNFATFKAYCDNKNNSIHTDSLHAMTGGILEHIVGAAGQTFNWNGMPITTPDSGLLGFYNGFTKILPSLKPLTMGETALIRNFINAIITESFRAIGDACTNLTTANHMRKLDAMVSRLRVVYTTYRNNLVASLISTRAMNLSPV